MEHWKILINSVNLIISIGILITIIIYVYKNKKIVEDSKKTALDLENNAKASNKTLNISKKILGEMEDLRRIQNLPNIVGFFKREVTEKTDRIFFVLQNIGNGIAKDLTFTFTPELTGNDTSEAGNINEMGRNKTLVPSDYQYKMAFARSSEYINHNEPVFEDLPCKFSLTIECVDFVTNKDLKFEYDLNLKTPLGVCQ